jgi:hypothetical protein
MTLPRRTSLYKEVWGAAQWVDRALEIAEKASQNAPNGAASKEYSEVETELRDIQAKFAALVMHWE